MARLHEIEVEPMTAEAFAPFGEILDAPAHPAERQITPTGFECDGRITASVIWQPFAPPRFSRLERHFGVTQCFVQLSGAPAVVCVAEQTGEDPHDIPAPAAVRAFRIDRERGFAFHRGTWHSLDRYVLEPPGATFVILNSDPNPTQIVDYTRGESLVYRDLDVDPSPDRLELDGDFDIEFKVAP